MCSNVGPSQLAAPQQEGGMESLGSSRQPVREDAFQKSAGDCQYGDQDTQSEVCSHQQTHKPSAQFSTDGLTHFIFSDAAPGGGKPLASLR